jgi:hypothetical protein
VRTLLGHRSGCGGGESGGGCVRRTLGAHRKSKCKTTKAQKQTPHNHNQTRKEEKDEAEKRSGKHKSKSQKRATNKPTGPKSRTSNKKHKSIKQM